MSHITTVESKVTFVDEGLIKNALDTLCSRYEGMTVKQDSPDIIRVDYKPIQVYRKNSMFFQLENEKWLLKTDDWHCKDLMKDLVSQTTQAYQTECIQRVFRNRGYITAQNERQQNKNHRLVMRSYK